MSFVAIMANEVATELHYGSFLTNGRPYKHDGGTIDIMIHIDLDKFNY